MKILLTGGAGYIGSHIVIALQQAGHECIIFDNFSTSSIDVLQHLKKICGKKISYIKGDIRNKQLLTDTFKRYNVDLVIHLAGLKSVEESFENILEYYNNNFYGTLQLVEAMKENNVNKLIFSSSATVYGLPKNLPLTEEHITNPTNPYGMIKLNIEDMLRFFSIKFPNFQSIILRYFNPVGAHHSGLIGDGSKIANNLIPIIVKVANKEIIELNIFGNDYDTCDGTCVRDFVHVMDVAEGHVACLNHFKENTGLSIFNLGTGKGHSVLQILNEFIKVNKVEVPHSFVKRREGDVPISYANVDEIYNKVGWESKYSLQDMCKSAWKFKIENK